MSLTIEWAHVASAGMYLVLGDEDAGDGNTPNGEIDGSDESQNIALVVEGCALYGTPDELMAWLSAAKQRLISHMIDEAEKRGPVADAETVLEIPESGEQVPF
jgi:hypothetical protein